MPPVGEDGPIARSAAIVQCSFPTPTNYGKRLLIGYADGRLAFFALPDLLPIAADGSLPAVAGSPVQALASCCEQCDDRDPAGSAGVAAYIHRQGPLTVVSAADLVTTQVDVVPRKHSNPRSPFFFRACGIYEPGASDTPAVAAVSVSSSRGSLISVFSIECSKAEVPAETAISPDVGSLNASGIHRRGARRRVSPDLDKGPATTATITLSPLSGNTVRISADPVAAMTVCDQLAAFGSVEGELGVVRLPSDPIRGEARCCCRLPAKEAHEAGLITAVEFSPSGALLASASAAGLLHVHALRSTRTGSSHALLRMLLLLLVVICVAVLLPRYRAFVGQPEESFDY
eukprot:gnl/Ergobibamus_cyprinoides/1873.p1 GENE.gnl/Ergobibamus_cyprinoides/1873~~gnl/Ergobibamus_cyprinoides/1873.p1  ORF type:complete len:345 (-),score=68.97 gnl/Ergobibamus_cyprinoides/1873:43-1077(-)